MLELLVLVAFFPPQAGEAPVSPPPPDTVWSRSCTQLGILVWLPTSHRSGSYIVHISMVSQLPSEVPTFFYELLEEYISLEIPFSADRNPAFLCH